MEQIIALVSIAIAAILAQRIFGPKGLLFVWLGSALLLTGIIFTQGYYKSGPLSTGQVLLATVYLFVIFITFSGISVVVASMLVLVVGMFGSRPTHAFLPEVNDFPLDDAQGLTRIRWRYHTLLATHAAALNAVHLHPYQSPLRGFIRGLQVLFSGAVGQAWEHTQRVANVGVPSALVMDLIGAEPVLAELEMLTPAQFLAIEECHRVNVRRLRQRIIDRSWPVPLFTVITGIAGVLAYLIQNAGKVREVVGIEWGDLLSPVLEINALIWPFLTLHWPLIIGLVGVVVIGLIIIRITSPPTLPRLEAFGDILTIAKAYRKGAGETTKP